MRSYDVRPHDGRGGPNVVPSHSAIRGGLLNYHVGLQAVSE